MVVAKNATTTLNGAIAGQIQRHEVLFYNLDVIISVGYRDKSKRGTQFRIWANSVLKDYLIKGYAVRNDFAQQKYDDLKALVDVMVGESSLFGNEKDQSFRSSIGQIYQTWDGIEPLLSAAPGNN